MSEWQNMTLMQFDGVGEYGVPLLGPVYELPKVRKHIEFDYAPRIREGHDNIAVHFFEQDFKFERCWNAPDRYAKTLQKFGYILSPDFSQFYDMPKAMQVYNHYRNMWLAKYWQTCYNMTVVPTVMWGLEDSYDWCFDGYPVHSIVAVSNVGVSQDAVDKKMFIDGYNKMLEVLEPSLVLFHTRNFQEVPGNVQYIQWVMHKEDQLK